LATSLADILSKQQPRYSWKTGDRVVSETAAVIDVNNPLSKQGFYNLDPTRKGFGYGVNGAMTRYVKVPARCLHHVPDELAFEQACLTEPCCVAYNAVVENSRLKPGDRVIVLGREQLVFYVPPLQNFVALMLQLLGLKQICIA
jgi:alcohol dehydrogenase/L-iditol 2-dehydrogenase